MQTSGVSFTGVHRRNDAGRQSPGSLPFLGSQAGERIKNMKNNYSVAQRNAIVVEHLWCINAVIRQNRALMRTAGLDYDDVYQQLAIRLIRSVAGFDPDKGKLEQHIFAQLKFELLNCKTPYRLCGMTGLPKDYCKEKIIPFEAIQESCDLYEQAMTA